MIKIQAILSYRVCLYANISILKKKQYRARFLCQDSSRSTLFFPSDTSADFLPRRRERIEDRSWAKTRSHSLMHAIHTRKIRIILWRREFSLVFAAARKKLLILSRCPSAQHRLFLSTEIILPVLSCRRRHRCRRYCFCRACYRYIFSRTLQVQKNRRNIA